MFHEQREVTNEGTRRYKTFTVRSRESRKVMHLEIKEIRNIAHGTFGEISLVQNKAGEYFAMKDFFDEDAQMYAIHGFTTHQSLVEAEIPTFEKYYLVVNEDGEGKVIMSYIGTPESDMNSPREGDEVCIGPLQESKSFKTVRRDGVWFNEEVLCVLREQAQDIANKAAKKNIRLTHDSVLVQLRYGGGKWNPYRIMIGDFDAIVLTKEGEYTEEVLRRENKTAVWGVIEGFFVNMKGNSEDRQENTWPTPGKWGDL